MDLKETISGLKKNYWRINELWFRVICKDLNYDDAEIKPLFDKFTKGLLDFIEFAPLDIVTRIASIGESEYEHNLLQTYLSDYKNKTDYRKIIYEENDETKFIQLNFLNSNDLLQLRDMLMSDRINVKFVLRAIDEISQSKKILYSGSADKYNRIYEYDIIGAAENDWKRKKELYICYLDKHSPLYQELIWTKKYGYWNSEGHLHKSDDNMLSKILNLNGRYNSYAVTQADYYEVIGNLLLDKSILNPENEITI